MKKLCSTLLSLLEFLLKLFILEVTNIIIQYSPITIKQKCMEYSISYTKPQTAFSKYRQFYYFGTSYTPDTRGILHSQRNSNHFFKVTYQVFWGKSCISWFMQLFLVLLQKILWRQIVRYVLTKFYVSLLIILNQWGHIWLSPITFWFN